MVKWKLSDMDLQFSNLFLTTCIQFFKRFPTLREKFYHVVIAFFKKALNPTNKLVSDLVKYV